MKIFIKYTLAFFACLAAYAYPNKSLALHCIADTTATLKPGSVVYGSNRYTQFMVGDLASPIILSSPHAGTLRPNEIPDRTEGVLKSDVFVTDLVLKMADTIQKLTGLRPHIIINNLHRIKMEPNRSLDDAFLTNADAIAAWNDYQGFIMKARKIVEQHVGKGLYLDMHGHAHPIHRIEVGYLLRPAELNEDDAAIDKKASQSSIRALALSTKKPFSALIRGDISLGTLLQNEGYRAVPSKQEPTPGTDKYFNGGYCTAEYGSRKGGNISAIQLETPGVDVRNTPALRAKSSGAIARAALKYLNLNYDMNLIR
ncbi:hypothetical protein ABDD95_05365 [Mucilaginibacter sp. PAMB04274]|uniref:hypothetical protein n=1 Tax=Mucilaginibacter sp. PAMB04274 TaxID=3138568 RepID=UPI0031F63AD7